jgi:hypothetical protein
MKKPVGFETAYHYFNIRICPRNLEIPKEACSHGSLRFLSGFQSRIDKENNKITIALKSGLS